MVSGIAKPDKRLTKIRRKASSKSSHSVALVDDAALTYSNDTQEDLLTHSQTSCDALRSSPSTHLQLRERFNNSFPSELSLSTERATTPTSATMSKERSRSRTDLLGERSPRLPFESPISPMDSPTMEMEQTLDIPAAIALLQELKKHASPEELVALHKALLPTKSTEDGRHGSYRHSRLLPGLATRGDDPLQTIEQMSHKRQSHRDQKRRKSASNLLRITELSIDDDVEPRSRASLPTVKQSPRQLRPVSTCEDATMQVGIYRTGTLRITNRSPSPTLTFRTVQDLDGVYDSRSLADTKVDSGISLTELQIETERLALETDERIQREEELNRSLPPVSPSRDLHPSTASLNAAMQEYTEFTGSPYKHQSMPVIVAERVDGALSPCLSPEPSALDLVRWKTDDGFELPPLDLAKFDLEVPAMDLDESDQYGDSDLEQPVFTHYSNADIGRPVMFTHGDSGYGSEESADRPSRSLDSQRKSESDAQAPMLEVPVMPRHQPPSIPAAATPPIRTEAGLSREEMSEQQPGAQVLAPAAVTEQLVHQRARPYEHCRKTNEHSVVVKSSPTQDRQARLMDQHTQALLGIPRSVVVRERSVKPALQQDRCDRENMPPIPPYTLRTPAEEAYWSKSLSALPDHENIFAPPGNENTKSRRSFFGAFGLGKKPSANKHHTSEQSTASSLKSRPRTAEDKNTALQTMDANAVESAKKPGVVAADKKERAPRKLKKSAPRHVKRARKELAKYEAESESEEAKHVIEEEDDFDMQPDWFWQDDYSVPAVPTTVISVQPAPRQHNKWQAYPHASRRQRNLSVVQEVDHDSLMDQEVSYPKPLEVVEESRSVQPRPTTSRSNVSAVHRANPSVTSTVSSINSTQLELIEEAQNATIDWAVQAKFWRARRTQVGNTLEQRGPEVDERDFKFRGVAETCDYPRRQSSLMPGRYSGGLQYEWSREVGITSSAGSSTTNGNMEHGRSAPSKMQYGLDLMFVSQHPAY